MERGASLWNSFDCGYPLGDLDHVVTIVQEDFIHIFVLDSKAYSGPNSELEQNGEIGLSTKLVSAGNSRLRWLADRLKSSLPQKNRESLWVGDAEVTLSYYYVYTSVHQQNWSVAEEDDGRQWVSVISVDKIVAHLRRLISASTLPNESLDVVMEEMVEADDDLATMRDRFAELAGLSIEQDFIEKALVIEDHPHMGYGLPGVLLNINPYNLHLDYASTAAQADSLAEIENRLMEETSNDAWPQGSTIRYLIGL